MRAHARTLRFEVELDPEEQLTLPAELAACVRGGSWIVTIEPSDGTFDEADRDHASFLSGYSESDEGLYDDVPAR